MILTDSKTVCDKEAAARHIKDLQSEDSDPGAVRILSVSIGPDAEPQEMEKIGIKRNDIIKSSGLEIPIKLGKKISASTFTR